MLHRILLFFLVCDFATQNSPQNYVSSSLLSDFATQTSPQNFVVCLPHKTPNNLVCGFSSSDYHTKLSTQSCGYIPTSPDSNTQNSVSSTFVTDSLIFHLRASLTPQTDVLVAPSSSSRSSNVSRFPLGRLCTVWLKFDSLLSNHPLHWEKLPSFSGIYTNWTNYDLTYDTLTKGDPVSDSTTLQHFNTLIPLVSSSPRRLCQPKPEIKTHLFVSRYPTSPSVTGRR